MDKYNFIHYKPNLTMPAKYTPPLVISVHGIRTKALWQQFLSETLKEFNISHSPYNYGYYNIFRFLLKQSNERMVDRFYEFYSTVVSDTKEKVDIDNSQKRPSIIAHSFGTYIIGYCLLKYPDVKFDKIILCGSILPRDFEWTTLFMRDQVNHVQNEYGLYDFWTKNVGKFVRKTGNSGTYGFHITTMHLNDIRFEYFKHSDYFNGQHFRKYWLPLLQKFPSMFYIKHGHDFENLSYFSDILDTTGTVIDEICYGNLEHYDAVEIPRGLSLSWIRINPDIYTFLFDQSTNTVKGYINAMPISDESFDKIKNGELQDNEITEDHVMPFLNNQILKMYLMSVAIDPIARKANEGLLYLAFEKLINGLINKLIYHFMTYNIRISQFIAVGWTSEGRRLCKILGMTETGRDKFNNPIYIIDFEDENLSKRELLTESIKKLALIYKKNKNNNFKYLS